MSWTGKPCARCGGKKGPHYANAKHCGRCVLQVRKEAKARAHDTAVSRRYGIEPGDYLKIYNYQNGTCAICLRATGRTRWLSVDHSHTSLAVRGLLCRPCNNLLGHGRDDPLFFLRVIHYLSDPPATKALGRTVLSPYPLGGPDLGPESLSAGRVTA